MAAQFGYAKRLIAGILLTALSLCGERALSQAEALSTQNKLNIILNAAEQIDPMPELEQLCEGIGPRLTGSTAAHKAESKVLAYMRAIGLRQVHSESWMLPRSWLRESARASLGAPFDRRK